MGASAGAIAGIITAISSAASAAYSIKRGQAQKGEVSQAKKKAATEKKERDRQLELKKQKSPGQRLLGGRPTLG